LILSILMIGWTANLVINAGDYFARLAAYHLRRVLRDRGRQAPR
jgi:hypothetical protein